MCCQVGRLNGVQYASESARWNTGCLQGCVEYFRSTRYDHGIASEIGGKCLYTAEYSFVIGSSDGWLDG